MCTTVYIFFSMLMIVVQYVVTISTFHKTVSQVINLEPPNHVFKSKTLMHAPSVTEATVTITLTIKKKIIQAYQQHSCLPYDTLVLCCRREDENQSVVSLQ